MEENKNIQENNEIQNTPMNEPKKDNSVMILLIAIIIGLAGYIVYTKVFAGDKPTPPKENDTKETNKEEQKEKNNNQNNTFDINKLAGMTFKTKDGKNSLKIVSKDDQEAREKAKTMEFIGEEISEDVDYLGYYNDTLFLIYKTDEKTNNNKYIILGGREEGNIPQCSYTDEFIINTTDNTLVNIHAQYYQIHKVGEQYYFTTGSCAMAFHPENVYNENEQEIGQYFINSDNNENIYVLNNNHITKYNKEGNLVINTIMEYSIENINKESAAYNDTVYIIAKINDVLYLVDAVTEEKYELVGIDDYFSSPGMDSDTIYLTNNNGIIEIFYIYYEDGAKQKTITHTFNPETKELIKK